VYRIDPKALHLAREFRDNPIGHHSPDLELVLNVLRAGSVQGKYCLVCTRPFQEWPLARLSGQRGLPPEILHNRVYHSIADAEWDVFKLRWADVTGHTIDDAEL